MRKQTSRKGFQPLAEMALQLVDPILHKRAGLNIQLLESWPEIVGPDIAAVSQPQKIIWPRRAHEDDAFVPATLLVACEGFSAMKLQHESGEVIERINVFFGFSAIGRLKIEQKPVRAPTPLPPRAVVLDDQEHQLLQHMTTEIDNDALRQALLRLGTGILGGKMQHRRC